MDKDNGLLILEIHKEISSKIYIQAMDEIKKFWDTHGDESIMALVSKGESPELLELRRALFYIDTFYNGIRLLYSLGKLSDNAVHGMSESIGVSMYISHIQPLIVHLPNPRKDTADQFVFWCRFLVSK